ncbi:MAG: hypothetical protein QOC54_2038, partial [Baekduia sp.]|nr:hypothetical protein [Baekduia sp.]
RRNDELVLGKLAALDAVDRELRAIERVLDERRYIVELREPGVAACPRCGALHGSDAKFCPQCGTQFSGPLAMIEVGGTIAPAPAGAPEAQTPEQPLPAPDAPAAPADPVSAAELGATPVSGALAGAPVAPAAEQPTQALPAVTPEQAAGHGDGAATTVTGGDPLAARDRPDA